MKLTGENRCTRGTTCPSTPLSTTIPAWTDPGFVAFMEPSMLISCPKEHSSVPIQSQMNSVHTYVLYLKIRFIVILPSTPRSSM
jgi:hypothetical protein